MLLLLTVVSGFVDATSFLKLGRIFVANMTGNVVFLGFAAIGAGGVSLTAPALCLIAFLAGAALSGRLATTKLGRDPFRLLRTAIAVELALVAVAMIVAVVRANDLGGSVGPTTYVLMALLATAMGIQTATARRLAVPDLQTTVLTSTLSALAVGSWFGGNSSAGTGRRLLAIAAMLIGAIVGAFLALKINLMAPLAAVAVLLAIAGLGAHRLARRLPDPLPARPS